MSGLKRRLCAGLFLIVFMVLALPMAALAQVAGEVAEAPPADPIVGITAAVIGLLALLGSLVARWTQTPAELPWYIRLARVLDATQIVDSTRSLGDK